MLATKDHVLVSACVPINRDFSANFLTLDGLKKVNVVLYGKTVTISHWDNTGGFFRRTKHQSYRMDNVPKAWDWIV